MNNYHFWLNWIESGKKNLICVIVLILRALSYIFLHPVTAYFLWENFDISFGLAESSNFIILNRNF
jgi:hypothetical protein